MQLSNLILLQVFLFDSGINDSLYVDIEHNFISINCHTFNTKLDFIFNINLIYI